MATIGDRIRRLRKTAGLTQPTLAKAVGIDQSTLSDIERGAGFSAETLMRLAEQLETSCEFIMRGTTKQSETLRRAQAAVSQLSNDERAALFAAIAQPAVPDHHVAKHLPMPPSDLLPTPEDEAVYERLVSRAEVKPTPNKKKSA